MSDRPTTFRSKPRGKPTMRADKCAGLSRATFIQQFCLSTDLRGLSRGVEPPAHQAIFGVRGRFAGQDFAGSFGTGSEYGGPVFRLRPERTPELRARMTSMRDANYDRSKPDAAPRRQRVTSARADVSTRNRASIDLDDPGSQKGSFRETLVNSPCMLLSSRGRFQCLA